MNTIRTTVKNRHIDIPAPDNMPDGTEIIVDIHLPMEKEWLDESEWDETPLGNETWIEWAKSLKPMHFTPEESLLIDQVLQEDKLTEISNYETHAENLRKLFE